VVWIRYFGIGDILGISMFGLLHVARNGSVVSKAQMFASERWAQWIRCKKDEAMFCATAGCQL
jgi:hypothetical protein